MNYIDEPKIVEEFAVKAVQGINGETVYLIYQAGELLKSFTSKGLLDALERVDRKLLNLSPAENDPTPEEQEFIDDVRCAGALIQFFTRLKDDSEK